MPYLQMMPRRLPLYALAALALTAFSAAAAQTRSGVEQARLDSLRHPYTKADIDFMTGMIAHHAQAIVMARMAPTRDASPAVQILCARIINAQLDEIRTM